MTDPVTDNLTVLDASAVHAWLQREPGWDVGVVSAVNWSEIVQKVLEHAPEEVSDLRADLEALGVAVLPFGVREAETAAALCEPFAHLGCRWPTAPAWPPGWRSVCRS